MRLLIGLFDLRTHRLFSSASLGGTKLPTSSGGCGTTAIEDATDTLVRQQMLGAVAPAADGEPMADRIGITQP